MLQEESLSNEEELAVWQKLATLLEHLGIDDFHQHGDIVTSVVPLELYQRMACKCNTLEQEQKLLKREFLDVMQSS
jgi:DNA polymerase III epsilon subunit-like protein